MTASPANRTLARLPTTIFTVMSALATDLGAINLGQGFPDDDGPEDLRAAAARHVLAGPSQYPPMMGAKALRAAVASHDARFYGITVDPDREVLVTSGATEALAAAFFGLLNPGDEVIVLQPAYDSYVPVIRLLGAIPRFVTLNPPDWRITRADLEAAAGPSTRAIVINSPMNPTGKVLDDAERAILADFVQARDLVAICDEVYEHIVFSGARHVPLMTMPGLAGRCVRIASAGKTFGMTGWKVGYVTAPAPLAKALAQAHQYLTFTTPPALQLAVAEGLGKEDAYFATLAGDLEAKRDHLARGLKALGLTVLEPQGTYFLVVDARDQGARDDKAYAEHLVRRAGVATIPLSAFYEGAAPEGLIRFCFSKQYAVLDAALDRLGAAARAGLLSAPPA